MHIQVLQSEEQQLPQSEIYVQELACELRRLITSEMYDFVILTGMTFVDDTNVTCLPTRDLLNLCYQHDIFPTLGLPLDASKELIVTRRMNEWRNNLPPQRPKKVLKAVDRDAVLSTMLYFQNT